MICRAGRSPPGLSLRPIPERFSAVPLLVHLRHEVGARSVRCDAGNLLGPCQANRRIARLRAPPVLTPAHSSALGIHWPESDPVAPGNFPARHPGGFSRARLLATIQIRSPRVSVQAAELQRGGKREVIDVGHRFRSLTPLGSRDLFDTQVSAA